MAGSQLLWRKERRYGCGLDSRERRRFGASERKRRGVML